MPSSNISFRDIPKTSQLFSDYLYDFERVSSFFERTTGVDSFVERARRVTSQQFQRDAVADVLLDQNRNLGAGETALANIELLRNPESVVVITGQQAGLFTGPLFTIYKALTVIKLTERLREKGLKVVPMFWIASEDHDFAEVNHCQVVNREGQLQRITYTACPPGEGKPVGHVELCSEIENDITKLVGSLPESEFVAQIEQDLRASYQSGQNFAKAFAKLTTILFGKYGVVTIDPLDERLKRVAGDIYAQAISRVDDFAAGLLAANSSLEAAGYHSQVHVTQESVPLFYLANGRRTALHRDHDGSFSAKSGSTKFETQSLKEKVAQCPACFSPNVTLRPIVQDFLLPTLAYIGGPAEIAYFAQIRPGYQVLGRLEPLILPRASMTIVERRLAKVMEKQKISFTDLFHGPDAVITKVVEQSLDSETSKAFERSEKVIGDEIENLRVSLSGVDPTLAEALKSGREKIMYQLANLKTRFIHNRAKRDETIRQQIDRMFAVLYPNKNLQEREINATYFLARYGYGLIDVLLNEIDLDSRDHKLVWL